MNEKNKKLTNLKQRLYDLSIHGSLRPLAKPVHSALISMALAKESLIDRCILHQQNQKLIAANITAVIKTFERPEILKRLVRSLRRFYPTMRVIVVDDSRAPTYIEGVETIIMPYDSGVSAGRQKALKYVQTPYMLLLDDDFIFYRRTKLQPVLEKLQRLPQIDLIGGEVIYLPFYRKIDYTADYLHPTKAKSLIVPGTKIEKMVVLDKVANFYLARTESIRKVGWDPRIKRLDHADFFTRAKGKLCTVFDPSFKILHARTPFAQSYMQKRMDVDPDRKLLWMKYYFKR